MTKGMWLAVALLVVYMVPMTQLALQPSPPAMRGNQQIVWVVNQKTNKAEPKLQAECPPAIEVWGGWFGRVLNNFFFGTPATCSGGGFGGGGGAAF